MQVAVCISGQPRNVRRGFVFIQANLLAHNDCDVFVHTWFNSEQVGKPFVGVNDTVMSDTLQDNVLDEIVRLYQPIEMQSEPQMDFDERDYKPPAEFWAIKPFTSLSQKYSTYRVQEIRRDWQEKSGKKYDAVVRLRFDYALQQPISADAFDLSEMNVPNRCTHPGGIDDTFAISNEVNMNIYGDLFNHIQELYDSGVPFCDEILLGQHLGKNNVPVHLHKIAYDLIRA